MGKFIEESLFVPGIDYWLAREVEPAVVSDENFFMLTSSADATYSSKTIRSRSTCEMLKIAPIRFAFRANLSTLAIHGRCAEDPLRQIAQRCQLQLVTASQVGQGNITTRVYSIHLI